MGVQTELTSIRVDLEEDLSQQFQTIKSHYGIRTTTDMIRFLIREKFRQIKQGESQPSATKEVGVLSENEQCQLAVVAEEYYQQFQNLDEAGIKDTLEDRYPQWPPEKIQAGVEYVCSLKKN